MAATAELISASNSERDSVDKWDTSEAYNHSVFLNQTANFVIIGDVMVV